MKVNLLMVYYVVCISRSHLCPKQIGACCERAVLDVAVDIRTGSPTFGQHVSIELTEDNHRQFFIPRGFAHGFSVLSEEVIFQYKCDNLYAPQYEGAIAWDDPDLGIDWHIPKDKMLLSEKDKIHPRLKEAEWLFDYSDMLYCVPE